MSYKYNNNHKKMSTHKYCKDCKEVLPIDDFYKAGKYRQSRCKPCYNKHTHGNLKRARAIYKLKNPPKKKLNGFQKLSDDQKAELLKYLGTMPMVNVANMVGLNKYTLLRWKKKKYFPETEYFKYPLKPNPQ